MALSIASAISYAEGTVIPTYSNSAPPFVKYHGEFNLFDTQEEACIDWIAYQTVELGWKGWVYDRVEKRNENQISCFARDPATGTVAWYSIIAIMRSCDGRAWDNYEMTCKRNVCPANSTGSPESNPTSCTCDDNYVPDATQTRCVLATCSVTTKVADITDPVALLYENGTYSSKRPDLEHLTPETQAGLACIQQKVAALNCYMTPQPTSGYRPAAYQQHLLEVYDKWQLIKDDNTPACAETKAAIREEYNHHKKFARRPGETSNHSQVDAQGNPAGNAVDISFVPDNVNDVSADAIACQCNMYRPLINMPDPTKNDPVHYQPRTCPR